MSCVPQLAQHTGQVWGAKRENVERTPQFLLENILNNAFLPSMLNLSGCLVSIPINPIRKIKAEPEVSMKERALAFARRDRSIPINLRLRKGAIKELTKGIFVKKTSAGVLEIYLSEE